MSQSTNVTLANPLQPSRRGPAAVAEAALKEGAIFQEGAPVRFEEVVSEFEEPAVHDGPDPDCWTCDSS